MSTQDQLREQLERIEEPEVREFVRANLADMTDEVQSRLAALQHIPIADRAELRDAYEPDVQLLVKGLMPVWELEGLTLEWDWEKIKAAVLAAVWNLFCNREDGQGKPDEFWKKLFDEGGVGTEAIEAAIVAAFTAVGAIGGLVGATLGGTLGKMLKKFLVGMVAKELDGVVESGLGAYCAITPA